MRGSSNGNISSLVDKLKINGSPQMIKKISLPFSQKVYNQKPKFAEGNHKFRIKTQQENSINGQDSTIQQSKLYLNTQIDQIDLQNIIKSDIKTTQSPIAKKFNNFSDQNLQKKQTQKNNIPINPQIYGQQFQKIYQSKQNTQKNKYLKSQSNEKQVQKYKNNVSINLLELRNNFNKFQNKLQNQNIIPKKSLQVFKNKSTNNHERSVQWCLNNVHDKKHKYQFGKIIGEGSYALVKLGVEIINEKKVAIKIYDKSQLGDHQRRQNVIREVDMLQKIKHKNIIGLIEVFSDDTQLFIVMEYIGKMTLYQHLKNQSMSRLTVESIQDLFRQLVEAVDYLHSHNIVHRDIKLENIMVKKEKGNIKDTFIVKLIDFGFALQLNSSRQYMKEFCGTPCYMAPELIIQKPYRAQPVDIWALGVILYVLLVGKFPFQPKANKEPDEEDQQLYKSILNNKVIYPSSLPPIAYALFKSLFTLQLSHRLTAKQLLVHPFLL